jgi:hypothetical protein
MEYVERDHQTHTSGEQGRRDWGGGLGSLATVTRGTHHRALDTEPEESTKPTYHQASIFALTLAFTFTLIVK